MDSLAAWMSPSAMPATQAEGRCHQAPPLPRKVKVDVAKRHACHANSCCDHSAKREPSAPADPVQCHKCHTCHAKWRSMSPSATSVTQNDGRCRQVPRLPRKQPRRPRRQTGPKRAIRVSHTCHAKWRSMSPSATPATQTAAATTAPNENQGRHQTQPSANSISATPAPQRACRCRPVPRLPRKVTVDVAKYHAKCRSMSPSATPATQSEGRCRQVPRLPLEQPRRQRRLLVTKQATRASPAS